jgi:hypothetical protein
MADEHLFADIQWSLVALRGYDADGHLVATRTGFLLDDNLVVAGSFKDRPEIGQINIFHKDDDVTGPEVYVCQQADLRLYEVNYSLLDYGYIGTRWKPRVGDFTPPNVGDDLFAIGWDGSRVEFEFQGVREIAHWGTVLRVPILMGGEMDGSPVVNEAGCLVAIVRSRLVDGEDLSFALPISWLSNLILGTLLDTLANVKSLPEWRKWRDENWDDERQMTKSEVESQYKVKLLRQEVRRLRRRLAKLRLTQDANQNIAGVDRMSTVASVGIGSDNTAQEEGHTRKGRVRRSIGTLFYVLAAIATVYMYTGFAIFIIRDVRDQGFVRTMFERFVVPPVLVTASTFLLWSLPGLILFAIGATLRKDLGQ